MIEIARILDMLDWNMPVEIQLKGRLLAKKELSIGQMIQPLTPKHNKNVWENCAIIISDFNDGELEPHLVRLLEWLQDMNWPGANIIFKRLLEMPFEMLEMPYNIVLTIAKKNDDKAWIMILEDFKNHFV